MLVMWKNLKQTKHHVQNNSWVVISDFNEIRSQQYRIGSGVYSHCGQAEFIVAIEAALLLLFLIKLKSAALLLELL